MGKRKQSERLTDGGGKRLLGLFPAQYFDDAFSEENVEYCPQDDVSNYDNKGIQVF